MAKLYSFFNFSMPEASVRVRARLPPPIQTRINMNHSSEKTTDNNSSPAPPPPPAPFVLRPITASPITTTTTTATPESSSSPQPHHVSRLSSQDDTTPSPSPAPRYHPTKQQQHHHRLPSSSGDENANVDGVSTTTAATLINNRLKYVDDETESCDGQTVISHVSNVIDSMGGVLHCADTGVSIIVPPGAIQDGIQQEIYFKVCVL